MAVQHALPKLTAREAIQDAIYRAVTGLDRADRDLFNSAFTENAIVTLDATQLEGLEAINAGCYNKIASLDTTHMVSNIRAEVMEGASEGRATASALAQHFREGEGQKLGANRLLTGSFYDLELVKDVKELEHNLWRIKTWNVKIIWLEGDYGVLAGEK